MNQDEMKLYVRREFEDLVRRSLADGNPVVVVLHDGIDATVIDRDELFSQHPWSVTRWLKERAALLGAKALFSSRAESCYLLQIWAECASCVILWKAPIFKASDQMVAGELCAPVVLTGQLALKMGENELIGGVIAQSRSIEPEA